MERRVRVEVTGAFRPSPNPLPLGEGFIDMEYTPIKAPRGTQLSCKGWQQEAAMRMLMNNLDEDVAENPRKLIVYGQMTAGSWIYIGTQGIVQGTYETFAAAGRRHFNSSLEGKILVTGGMGGMGGAQPLAATMNGAAFLGIEVDPARIQRRIDTGYLDRMTTDLDEAWRTVTAARDERQAISIGLVGNCAEVLPEMVRRGWIPDLLTDQTSAHDPLNGYIPLGLTLEAAARLRESDPKKYTERSIESMAIHVQAMLEMQKRGAVVF